MASRTTEDPEAFRRFLSAAATIARWDGVSPTSCKPSHLREGNFPGVRNNRAHRLKASDEGPSSLVCGATFDVILASFWTTLGFFLAARRFASTVVSALPVWESTSELGYLRGPS
jgi:hypothetical protein